MKVEIGIIGGTGVYSQDMLKGQKEIEMETPYGKPSSPIVIGSYRGKKIAFLFRHGKDHSIPPHMINFRANIWAFKELGVRRILATCACGSLRENYRPGDIVIPDQFMDSGKDIHTFYDGGKERFYHVCFEPPFCPELRSVLADSAKRLGIRHHAKGTYMRISGPRFSTVSESKMFSNFADIIGMTGVPEAILCREKEMCLGIIATITDFDVCIGKPTPFEEMKIVMSKNLDNTKRILQDVLGKIPEKRKCICKDALKGAGA